MRALATLLLLASTAGAFADPDDPRVLERLAFGSCSRQDRPQPIWDVIGRGKPQLFLHLGDTIYADTEDMEKMRRDYAQMGAIPEFQRFRAQVPILAIWDDHDLGANDAGADYPRQEESKRLFLDFFEEPANSVRRSRRGVYLARIFGPPGRRVQVVLLDVRSFRDRPEPDPSGRLRYRPALDPARTLLGAEQWSWLAEQLRRPAEVRLIGSGIQVLGYAFGLESWKNFPFEQERLFALLRETQASGVVFLSGDLHFAQLERADGGADYPLYEFTSSGLTHGNPLGASHPAPLALHQPYGGINFGTIDIAWGDDPQLTLRARDAEGNPVFEHRIRLSELRPWVAPTP